MVIGDMLTGVAIGGPRDKIKLTAPYNWDGYVWITGNKVTYHTKRHAGQYIWDGINWVWYETFDDKSAAPDLRE